MSPKGRPTDDPKSKTLKIRLSEDDISKLEYCCRVLGLTRAEVVRYGVNRMYRQAMDKPTDYSSNNAFNRRKKKS